MNCGQPLQADLPIEQARHSRAVAPAPALLLEKAVAANRLSGERRMVTGLYLDVVRSRRLAETLGRDAALEIINGMLDQAALIIYRYEGTIARLQDDELLAFFGAPVAHEDDPVRAVHAALELLDFALEYAAEIRSRHNVDFALRLALSTGPVTLGPVDNNLHYDYLALGGTLTLVSQVEASKLPMSVLITEQTYRFVAPFFDCSDLGEMSQGQMSSPLRIYRVDRVRSIPVQSRGLAGLQSVLVGRDQELATLVQTSRLLQAGLGRAALILGEPGIGKTRLIMEWQKAVSASHPPLRWALGRCFSYSHDQPYHLVFSLLASLAGVPETAEEPEMRAALQALVERVFGEDTPAYWDTYAYLAHLLALRLEGPVQERVRDLDPQAHQSLAQAALRRLLIALSVASPLVVVLEDLHWADPSSVQFLSPLLPLAASERLMFCLVMRPERDAPGWQLAAIVREALGGRLSEMLLEPLSENDSRALVSNLLEIEALPETVRDLILRKADGNPFFVEEVIRMLIDRSAIIQVPGETPGAVRWAAGAQIHEVEIPDNLQGLLLARIDRLPDEVKQTLRVAAVIGRQFPVKVLEYVLALESTPDKL